MKVKQILVENFMITGVSSIAKQYYQQVIKFLSHQLDFSDHTIMIHIGLKGLFSQGHTGSTLPDPNRPHVIHIFIPPELDRATVLRAICHEAVHVEQLATKRLELDIQDGRLVGMKWQGKPVDQTKYNRSGPWELEAHSKENQLLQDVIQNVGNLKYPS